MGALQVDEEERPRRRPATPEEVARIREAQAAETNERMGRAQGCGAFGFALLCLLVIYWDLVQRAWVDLQRWLR